MINKKLGYYTVDNEIFDSKISACLYATKYDKDVVWHFNNDVYTRYNWWNEPIETLDELYDRRCRQLREQYDYIIISYSGGADSHNIVASFIRQGLHIDEIVVNTMEQANKKFTVVDPSIKTPENAAAEHYLQTIPRLKEIERLCPKTKITILDMSEYLLNSWLDVGDASWVLDKREGLNPLNVTRFNYLHFSDIRKQFDRDKKIGLILGVEKPRTFIYSNNKFYIRFIDRASNIITVENHIKDYTNSTVEYFYWSPDATDIICKQAHVIKRWLELNPQNQIYWWHENAGPTCFRKIHERVLRNIIYSTWNDSWYQADKAIKDWYSEFDSWFIKGYKGTTQYAIWKEGIDYIEKNASKYINTYHGYADGLDIHAYNYSIGEMKNTSSEHLKKLDIENFLTVTLKR
jgi:hypothetical protein